MSDQFTPTTETFRAIYAHMLAEWCREDALAEFDRLIDRVRRYAKVEALREFARSLDLEAIATEWSSNDHEHWAAGNAASAIQMAALDRADQLVQEGKNDE